MSPQLNLYLIKLWSRNEKIFGFFRTIISEHNHVQNRNSDAMEHLVLRGIMKKLTDGRSVDSTVLYLVARRYWWIHHFAHWSRCRHRCRHSKDSAVGPCSLVPAADFRCSGCLVRSTEGNQSSRMRKSVGKQGLKTETPVRECVCAFVQSSLRTQIQVLL